MGSSLALSTDQEDLRTARAQVPAAPAAAAAAEAEAAPAQDPLLDELVQRMARFERLEEDLRVDVDSHQGLLRALQDTQRQLHSQQDAMKVDGISEMSKQLSRCEEQIEELQTQLLQVQLPGSSLALSTDQEACSLALSTDQEVSLLPDFTERLEKCERQHQEFQQLLLSSSAKSESSEIARCEEQVKELRLLLHEQKSSRAEDPSFASAQGEMSQQISRCEQQVKELQQELREQKSSKPEVSAFNPHEDEDFTDHQLMLLDLQQRVSSLEGAPGVWRGWLLSISRRFAMELSVKASKMQLCNATGSLKRAEAQSPIALGDEQIFFWGSILACGSQVDAERRRGQGRLPPAKALTLLQARIGWGWEEEGAG
eukprot:s2591_g1.t5